MQARLPRLQARNAIAAGFRSWFADQEFTEVETPALQISPGMEPQLQAFATRLREPFEGGDGRLLYLHTSPEFAMKKLLAGGMERIFQMAKVWRNEERSATHHPEFTMVEWYRAGEGWRAVARDCEALVRAAVAAVPSGTLPEGAVFRWQGRECDALAPWRYLTVAEAFDQYCGIGVLATAPDPLVPDAAKLAQAAQGIGVRVGEKDGWDDIFFRIFLERIEPELGSGAPALLYDWPLSMAALARENPDDARFAERFEVYVCGMELANGFGELTDAIEQRRRFEAEIVRKAALTGETYPIDEDFLSALASGMPESAGIALGFDRLVMLCTGAVSIEDVLWAPVVTDDTHN